MKLGADWREGTHLFVTTYPLVNLLFDYKEEEWINILDVCGPNWDADIAGAFAWWRTEHEKTFRLLASLLQIGGLRGGYVVIRWHYV